MYDVEILETLQKGIIAAVEASDMPTPHAGRIQMVGLTFEPPADGKYLEVVFIPNNGDDQHWGDEKNYRGMLRLILHWPIDTQGPYPPMRVLKSVCAYFAKDEPLRLPDNLASVVQISNTPNSLAPLAQGGEALYPASLRYQSFRS
jgi:hypothetical protein